jgi:hypothetical protein
MNDLQKGRWASSRFHCELNRSFVLGLFTFVWFFIVPIPGLLVLTAPGGYRTSVPLGSLIAFTGWLLGVVLAGWCISLLLEWLTTSALGRRGLPARIEAQYLRFRTLTCAPGRLTAAQTASLYALFTDAQTYLDQRGYALARQTLGLIQQKLDSVPERNS